MAYSRVNWENLPSTNTPVNAANLNKMDAGIANAVEKTGDTLTGALMFNNKNEYDALRKLRTINNTDYGVAVGVGANAAARLELYTGSTSLGGVDVKTDGIYNNKTGYKLGETAHLTWGTSFSFTLENGHHALVMISNTDCLMLWAAGSPTTTLSSVRLYGNSANATYSGSTVTITLSGGGSFTGNAIIS